MSSYLVGNLLGRLIASYAIVWLVCLIVARGRWRDAFRRTGRWYAVLGLLVLFVAGLVGSVATGMRG